VILAVPVDELPFLQNGGDGDVTSSSAGPVHRLDPAHAAIQFAEVYARTVTGAAVDDQRSSYLMNLSPTGILN